MEIAQGWHTENAALVANLELKPEVIKQRKAETRLKWEAAHNALADKIEANIARPHDQAIAQFDAAQRPQPLTFGLADTSHDQAKKIGLAQLAHLERMQRSTEVAENLAYLPHATVDERIELLEGEAIRGEHGSLKLTSAIANGARQELLETPAHQRDGSEIERLERRARNLLADLRKARPSPAKDRATLVAARERDLAKARQRRAFFWRAVGWDGPDLLKMGAYGA